MRLIAVPLDGSPVSECVLPYASVLAKSLKYNVALLAVWETASDEEWLLGPEEAARVRDQGMQYFQRYLESVSKRLRQEGLDVFAEVRSGHPALEIMGAARQMEADLIAMASRGSGGVDHLKRGSVADKVLRGSESHTLIVGPCLEGPDRREVTLRNILVPLDGSRESETALPLAVTIAEAAGSRIALLRVVPGPSTRFPRLPETGRVEVGGRQAEAAMTYLEEVRARYGGVVADTAVERGVPGQKIVQVLEEERPDLVVMTSRSRFSAKPWALGSVADRVIDGPVPVLLVHPAAPA